MPSNEVNTIIDIEMSPSNKLISIAYIDRTIVWDFQNNSEKIQKIGAEQIAFLDEEHLIIGTKGNGISESDLKKNIVKAIFTYDPIVISKDVYDRDDSGKMVEMEVDNDIVAWGTIGGEVFFWKTDEDRYRKVTMTPKKWREGEDGKGTSK